MSTNQEILDYINNLLENANDNRNVLNFPTKIVFAPSFNYKSRNIPKGIFQFIGVSFKESHISFG